MADGTGGKGPTRGRTARTARLGRVAAGGAVRWAGSRLDSPRQRGGSAPAARRPDGRDDRLARRPARGDARRGDEGRPGALDDRVPRPRRGSGGAPAGPPRLASRQRPRRRLEGDARACSPPTGARTRSGCSRASTPSRPPRRASARSTAAARATGERRRDQGPVPGRRRGGRVGHAQPAPPLPASCGG